MQILIIITVEKNKLKSMLEILSSKYSQFLFKGMDKLNKLIKGKSIKPFVS